MSELFQVAGLWAAPVVDTSVTGDSQPEPILRGLDLAVGAGEVHAIMGPNGSGKSTLAATLMGSPEYEVTAGTITFRGDDIGDWPTDERAKAGMFLYIGATDLLPEAHAHPSVKRVALTVAGFAAMFAVSQVAAH